MGRSVPLGLVGQPLPACLPARQLHSVLLLMARASIARLARWPCWGGLCDPCLDRHSRRSRGVRAQAVARDHVSSYIALCYKINGFYSTCEHVVQLCPHYGW